MWMVVYIAQTKEMAEKVRVLLQKESVLVKVRALSRTAEDKYGCYEILVPESELDSAHDVIIRKLL